VEGGSGAGLMSAVPPRSAGMSRAREGGGGGGGGGGGCSRQTQLALSQPSYSYHPAHLQTLAIAVNPYACIT
jgi:hypothetical protein